MKKILIVSETSGQIVAYTTITGLESDWGLSDTEIIESRIQDAVDDEILEEDTYQYYETDKEIPSNIEYI